MQPVYRQPVMQRSNHGNEAIIYSSECCKVTPKSFVTDRLLENTLYFIFFFSLIFFLHKQERLDVFQSIKWDKTYF